jgi:outer membrane biosynthesis protein TonB
MLIKRLACAVLVLLAAAAVGVAIRGYRFWSWERQLAQAQKAAQPAAAPKTTQAPKEPESQNAQEQLPIEEVSVEPEPPAPEPVSPPKSLDAENQSNTAVQAEPAAAPSDQDQRSNDPAVKEQRGRTALAMIGHNPEADQVWIQTINDPTLSASARSNLIEDLNEDGLSYRNLTMDDLPVIKYRIQLIEDLSPYAMDKANADAFQEAHKDLVNMANRLARQ